MIKKICTKCEAEKELDQFHLEKRRGSYRPECKECASRSALKWRENNRDREKETSNKWYVANKERKAIKAKEWALNNREKLRAQDRQRYALNKAQIKERIALWTQANIEKIKTVKLHWRDINREKIRKQDRIISARRRSTLLGRLNNKMGSSMSRCLSGSKNGRKWESLVPYTVEQLKTHLENQFKDGMSWDNYGQWHIDHIIPISAFNYFSPDDIDFKRCWSLQNLRPLWATDNLKKRCRLEKPFQPSLSFEEGSIGVS